MVAAETHEAQRRKIAVLGELPDLALPFEVAPGFRHRLVVAAEELVGAPGELRVRRQRLAHPGLERLALRLLQVGDEESVVAHGLARAQRRAPQVALLPLAARPVGRRDVAGA